MIKSFLLILLTIGSAFAECNHLYPNQAPIQVKGTKELCNSWYVVRYDEKNRAVVLTSEILDERAMDSERSSKFKTDTRVRFPVTHSDYDQSGYDRGHMVPSADASNQKEMDETFIMTNVVPQAPKLNRGDWRVLESRIRSQNKGSMYVLTGAIYDGSVSGFLNVPIPRHLFKVVDKKEHSEYWIAENVDGARVLRTTKTKLESMIGYKLP